MLAERLDCPTGKNERREGGEARDATKPPFYAIIRAARTTAPSRLSQSLEGVMALVGVTDSLRH